MEAIKVINWNKKFQQRKEALNKYFKLDYKSGNWIPTEYDHRKQHIKIYEWVAGEMQLKGVGQY